MYLARPHTPQSKVTSASSSILNAASQQSRSSSQSINSTPRTQEVLMSLLVEELHDAVFESQSLLDAVYPLPEDVASRFDDAITKLANDALSASDPPSQPSCWKPIDMSMLDTSDEKQNYQALAKIFNTMLEVAKNHVVLNPTLKFIIYDKTTMDQADGQGALKPDLIAIDGGDTRERYLWSDIQLAVEVKGSWSRLLRHAATFGQSMLEQDKRWYSTVIAYNHAKKELRFCFFNRCGLFVTPALSLTTLEGFKAITRGLLGMLYRPRLQAGIDEHHRVHDGISYIYLPASNGDGHWWRVTDLLCQRICIRGRATHVYSAFAVGRLYNEAGCSQSVAEVTQDFVKPGSSPGPYSILESAITVNSSIRQGSVTQSATGSPPSQDRSNAQLSSKSMQPSKNTKGSKNLELPSTQASTLAIQFIASAQLAQSDVALLNKSTDITPDTIWPTLSTNHMAHMVLKESWPYKDRAMLETEMFKAVAGGHGIPDVIGSVSYPNMLHVFTSLKDFQVCADFDKVYSNSQAACPMPEHRTLVRMMCATQGTRLMCIADKPEILVKAIVDSMIGHMQLFRKGYLHRDVTIGNILVRHEPEERTPEMREKNDPILRETAFAFLELRLTSCLGFIIDGDLAINWKEARTLAKHRTGTLPFISYRVLSAWTINKLVLQTAIDDLESFAWVLLWAALQTSPEKTVVEVCWLEALSSDHVDRVTNQKYMIMHIADNLDPEEFSEPLQTVLPLLAEWFNIALDGRKKLDLFLKEWRGNHKLIHVREVAQESDQFFCQLEALCFVYYTLYLEKAVAFIDGYRSV